VRLVIKSLIVFTLLAPAVHSAESLQKPNIIFILTDDMGWGDLSCYGYQEQGSPNIDRLAKEGTRFTQFYVASPICSPSRVAYTTGMFPGRWRINDYLHERKANHDHEQADWLDPKAPTLARTLKQAGYATAHFGKWHMGGGRDVQEAPWPKEYGFDEHHVNCEGCGPRIDTFGSKEPQLVEGKMIARYQFTGFWADKGMDFIRRHKGQPFFLELWPQDVHRPHIPNPEETPAVANTPKPHQNFNAVLRGYDRDIGRLLDFLKSEGLEQNTIVVFASDNGPDPSFERKRSGGLRGMKWSLYEGGIREPMLVRWPGHVPAGHVEGTTVSSVDMFPSLCTLAGAPTPKDAPFDGVDMSAALLGKAHPRNKPLFWEYGRQADYLYPKEPDAKSPAVAMRDGKWKLLVNADGAGAELYDIDADRNETTNLAVKDPERAQRMTQQALQWRKSLP
jgi:arylsulfatase A-like enzyme